MAKKVVTPTTKPADKVVAKKTPAEPKVKAGPKRVETADAKPVEPAPKKAEAPKRTEPAVTKESWEAMTAIILSSAIRKDLKTEKQFPAVAIDDLSAISTFVDMQTNCLVYRMRKLSAKSGVTVTEWRVSNKDVLANRSRYMVLGKSKPITDVDVILTMPTYDTEDDYDYSIASGLFCVMTLTGATQDDVDRYDEAGDSVHDYDADELIAILKGITGQAYKSYSIVDPEVEKPKTHIGFIMYNETGSSRNHWVLCHGLRVYAPTLSKKPFNLEGFFGEQENGVVRYPLLVVVADEHKIKPSEVAQITGKVEPPLHYNCRTTAVPVGTSPGVTPVPIENDVLPGNEKKAKKKK